jgi:hypothetical protein
VRVTEPAPTVAQPRARDPFRLLAGVLCGLHALALLGFVGFYLYELAQGEGENATQVVMSAVLIAVFAVLLGIVARAWFRGADWPKTPTVLWNALLLPVAWSMFSADQRLLAVVLAVVAALGILAGAAARTSDPTAD